ncbi:MAG: DUF4390 domain-containing protein [Chromatiaceae bacterium]|jgi:hypothetical protein|nr:DUF4390 domain-containing protein [Chromatiaceae bacterium]
MRRLSARAALLLLLPLGLLFAALPVAAGNGFRVERVEPRVQGERVVLDAMIDYRFSAAALEAMENGVPLTVDVHIQVRRADAWVWEESLVDLRLRYQIRYRPLSERYVVTPLPGHEGTSYATRDAAIAALGTLDDLDLVGLDRLTPGERYEIHLRASLDIEELPLPLRPIAYLRPAWKLSTGWTKWPLEP